MKLRLCLICCVIATRTYVLGFRPCVLSASAAAGKRLIRYSRPEPEVVVDPQNRSAPPAPTGSGARHKGIKPANGSIAC